MTAADWPAWMPDYPTGHCRKCRADLLNWYQRAKAADPMVNPPHQSGRWPLAPVRPSDPATFDARVREAFPLPEDTALPFPEGTEGD